jgi:hypothetical protein
LTMTAQTMRSFAGGILVAAALLALVNFLSPSGVASKEKLSEKEMKKELTSDGYVVVSQKEWEAQLTAVKKAENTAKDAEKTAKDAKNKAKDAQSKAKDAQKSKGENKDQAQPEATEKVVYRTMVGVASGMTSIDVGNALVQSKIIPNAFEFSQEVERRGLSNGLKPGMYEVQSGMTMDEIIAVIFQ